MRSTVLLLALASPAILFAQFQQPTPDELKMTADPKAPGAAAVYLNVEEVANDPLHFQSFYARIKVLSEKGKELATVEVPYLQRNFQITDIKARTSSIATNCATTTTNTPLPPGRFSGPTSSTKRITSLRPSKHSCPAPKTPPACIWRMNMVA